MIRAIAFDIDDTLFDRRTAARQIWATLCRPFIPLEKWDTAEMIWKHVNQEVWRASDLGEVTVDEALRLRWVMTFERLGIDASHCTMLSEQYLALYPSLYRPLPYAVTLVHRLRSASIPLAVITNGVRTVQLRKLETLGLGQCFELIGTD